MEDCHEEIEEETVLKDPTRNYQPRDGNFFSFEKTTWPFLSLFASVSSAYLIFSVSQDRLDCGSLLEGAYMFLICGVTIKFYWSLRTNRSKHGIPWLVVKAIEIPLSVAAMVYGIIDGIFLAIVILAGILILCNIAIFGIGLMKIIRMGKIESAFSVYDNEEVLLP